MKQAEREQEINQTYAMLLVYPSDLIYSLTFFALYAWIGGGRDAVRLMYKNLLRPFVTALGTCSSTATMPTTMDRLERPRTDIIAVTMPCFGTTSRTKSNAELLCKALGVTFNEVPIGEAVRVHFRDIGHSESEHDVVYENAQARERTQVLMDIANDMPLWLETVRVVFAMPWPAKIS